MDFSSFWFGLYKLAKYMIYPYTWVVLLLGWLTILALRRISPWRLLCVRVLVLFTLLVVYALGCPVVAGLLAASLEEPYSPFDLRAGQRFDTIVVLGGGVYPKGSLRPFDTLSHISVERTMCGADLFHRGVAENVLFSGGDGSIIGEGPEDAVVMKQLATRLGVPEEAVLIENRSRTTYEAALEASRIIGKKSILLVTSASHMRRSLALFRKQGMDATPFPCGYYARDRGDALDITPFDFLPEVHALVISTNAISEMVGILVYRAIGKL
jgi:uncharacterized SAM-binding protein YcdF (DUF218 family)